MFFSKILSGFRYVQSALNLFIRSLRSKWIPQKENLFDQVIKAFYSNKYGANERAGINSIESVRNRLLQSKEVINRMEFGEGSNILSHSITKEKVSDICRIMSKSERECRFLYTLTRTLKPNQSIELGTCLGISTAYIAQALVQNGSGKLASFEGSPDRASIAIQNIKALGLDKIVSVVQGRFQDTLPDYLQNIELLNFAFIDGHHREDATLYYFNNLLRKFTNGGIMVFDDIFWSAGMNRAWKTIKSNHQVADSFVYRGMGVIQL